MDQPLADRLPLNRKERYYTGTVLPMIVCCDEFAHFGRFLRLCGAPDGAFVAGPAATNLQFFTEYGFKEALVDGSESFFGDPGGKDTPDVVVYIESNPSVLLGIEAKVFSRPSTSALKNQIQSQAELFSLMRDGLRTRPQVYQVALLPAGLKVCERIADAQVLTWELVADTFRDVAPAYWIRVLDEALERYDGLVSKASAGGQNNDGIRSGEVIKKQWDGGDREFTCMGRRGGLSGEDLARDIDTGGWREWDYEVRRNPLPSNRNWFSIESFLAKLSSASRHETPSPRIDPLVSERSVEPARATPRVPLTSKKSTFWKDAGKNADDKISGQEIYDSYARGDTTFTWMGRAGGRRGPKLLEDLKTGHWKRQKYEVRHKPISGNNNWFEIKSFVQGINLRQPIRKV